MSISSVGLPLGHAAIRNAAAPAHFKLTPVVLRDQNSREQTPRVVAYCVLPGAQDRFVITSDAQLVEVKQSGETSVVGVVTAPTSDEYLCMIQTSKLLIGVTGSGHLVNTENGSIVGAVVAVDLNQP